jgi:hypothetical protein
MAGRVSPQVRGVSYFRPSKLSLFCHDFKATFRQNPFFCLMVLCHRPYFGTSVGRNTSKDSNSDNRQGPMRLANILQHASQKSKDILKGAINGASSESSSSNSSYPAHHFAAGGTTCDPPPQPYRLAEYGEDSLYTLVLLRHGESEWNSLNRK